MALWALLTAGLVMFAFLVLPNVSAVQAKQQALLHAKLSSENDWYCRRWNFKPSTNQYRSCLDDLWQLRGSIANRLAQDQLF
jgi:hypothetical protein